MENFIVSARKYRPSTFQSVVGQSALTTTLKNAIKSNHLAHAYLFCGPRGVGKTTCARIFAKTINCLHLSAEGEACNQCESCVSFNDQRSYNIHELDAASNNGVDDIRSLIDQVRIPPQIGKYSVYIIDEVHMLSQGAFNAFLKTLEEPPAHALFILATTEKHKIIPTILSRCQIYDFNRITVADTVEHLRYVATQEGVIIDENALNIVAQKSDGGMRDALSIFDQLVSFCGNNIDYQGAISNLNVLDYEYYFRLVDAFLKNKVADALIIFNEILNKGFDGHHFVSGLSAHLRDLLVSKDPQTISLMEVGADIGKRYHQQAVECPADFLIQALKINNDCDLNYRISNNKRLLTELTIIRLCQLTDEKKKELTEDIPLPPIQKIEVTPADSVAISAIGIPTSVTSPNTETNKQVNNQSMPAEKPTENASLEIVSRRTPRPTSISISGFRPAKTEIKPTVSGVTVNPSLPSSPVIDANYSEAAFEIAWKKYATMIPEIVSVVSYLHSTLPVAMGDHSYQMTFSNIFQENEFKKLLPEFTSFMRRELQNSTIQFSTKVVENTEIPRSNNPEEILKKMSQENPALEKLKNNLRLEID